MSLPDPYRSYAIGVSVVGLNVAGDALHSAWGALLQSGEDMDGPIMSAISRAQTEVKTAQKLHSGLSWHDQKRVAVLDDKHQPGEGPRM